MCETVALSQTEEFNAVYLIELVQKNWVSGNNNNSIRFNAIILASRG